jgi:N6-adenosine-specific RNA methylase IME4
MTTFPFSIIYADPPWQYRVWRSAPIGMNGTLHRPGRIPPYPCLSTDQLCSLPIQSLAAKDCVLFLWATYPMLPDAFRVIEAWGFRYKTVAFTWVKTTRSGSGYHFGLGYWTRANPELCLLASKGSPKRIHRGIPNLLVSPIRDHSRKPDEARERIVKLCGDVPRAELFAREKVVGWASWGNEVKSDFILPV